MQYAKSQSTQISAGIGTPHARWRDKHHSRRPSTVAYIRLREPFGNILIVSIAARTRSRKLFFSRLQNHCFGSSKNKSLMAAPTMRIGVGHTTFICQCITLNQFGNYPALSISNTHTFQSLKELCPCIFSVGANRRKHFEIITNSGIIVGRTATWSTMDKGSSFIQ